MSIVHKSRVVLINISKVLPFIVCFIVCLSYCEGIYALATNNYIMFNDYVALNKPISHWIGNLFEYDALVVVVVAILSYATETCYWNKLSVLYLLLHLVFKAYIQDIELEETEICILSIINVILSGFLVYEGIKVLKLC